MSNYCVINRATELTERLEELTTDLDKVRDAANQLADLGSDSSLQDVYDAVDYASDLTDCDSIADQFEDLGCSLRDLITEAESYAAELSEKAKEAETEKAEAESSLNKAEDQLDTLKMEVRDVFNHEWWRDHPDPYGHHGLDCGDFSYDWSPPVRKVRDRLKEQAPTLFVV